MSVMARPGLARRGVVGQGKALGLYPQLTTAIEEALAA